MDGTLSHTVKRKGNKMNDTQVDTTKLQHELQTMQAAPIVCNNNDDKRHLMEVRKAVVLSRKSAVAYFRPQKEAAKKSHEIACANEKAFLVKYDAILSRIDNTVLDYNAAQERLARAEQARLQAIADEAARKERERLEKKAAKAETKSPEKAEALRQQAAEVIPAPVVVVPQAEKTAGESTRTTYKARLVSLADLIAAAAGGNMTAVSMITLDDKAANAFARATKGKIPVPGIEFSAEKTLVQRTV